MRYWKSPGPNRFLQSGGIFDTLYTYVGVGHSKCSMSVDVG